MEERTIAMLVMVFGFPLAFGVLAYFAKKLFGGCQCERCDGRMTSFSKLPPEDQEALLWYFRKYEEREPDQNRVYACEDCGQVYDDYTAAASRFDGEHITYCKVCDSNHVTFLADYLGGVAWYPAKLEEFAEAHPSLLDKVECLTCERGFRNGDSCPLCDTPVKVRGCGQCYTIYARMQVPNTKYGAMRPILDERNL